MPKYVNQIAMTATIAKPITSAAARPENPLPANGSPKTNSAITRSAAQRRPASLSVVPARCNRYNANGAAISNSVSTPSRIA